MYTNKRSMDNPGLELATEGGHGIYTLRPSHQPAAAMAANVSPRDMTVAIPGGSQRRPHSPRHTSSRRRPGSSRDEAGGMMRSQQRAILDRQWETFLRHWKSGLVLAVGYLLALLAFIAFYHIRNLPHAPYPVINNLLDWDAGFVPRVWWPQGPSLVLIMWGVIYLRKLLLLILRTFTLRQAAANTSGGDSLLRPTKHRDTNPPKTRCATFTMASLVLCYHFVIGLWTGWANNVYSGYIITEPLLLVIGLIFFVAAELILLVGACYHRVKDKPEGVYFTSAKYGCELMTWVGFALVSFTLPACVIFLCRIFLLAYLVKCDTRAVCCC